MRGWRDAVLIATLLATQMGSVAWAGVDAHGPNLPPSDGDPADPLFFLRPEIQDRGQVHLGAVLEFGQDPLIRVIRRGDVEERHVLLGSFLAVNLGGTYGVSDRFGLGLSLPVYLFATGEDTPNGPALGDAVLHAPVGLVLPERDGTGFGLSVAPALRLPIGAEGRYLGDHSLGAELAALLGYGTGPVRLAAEFGAEARTIGGTEDFDNGLWFHTGLSGTYLATEGLGVHLETRLVGLPSQGTPSVELLAGARGHLQSGIWWQAGISRGMTSGVGSPVVRVLTGVGYAPRLSEEDLVPTSDEPWLLVVSDPRGEPVLDAVVLVGGEDLGRTDVAGTWGTEDLKWRRGVTVSALGFVSVDLVEPTDTRRLEVSLAYAESPLSVAVQDQSGADVLGEVRITGEDGVSITAPTLGGEATVGLTPGLWTVEVLAEGMGRQVRDVLVEPGGGGIETRAILLPDAGGAAGAVLTFLDVEEKPIDGVRVLVDGQPVGASSTGGRLEVWGLTPGEHKLEIVADAYQSIEMADVQLVEGENAIPTTLRRAPGSVKVLVLGPDGPVGDATVRFQGPTRLPAQALGDDGERIFQVRPGQWSVLVLSPTYGVQTRDILVPADRTALTEVTVVLQPSEGGAAELSLRVLDPDGAPIGGARVLLDGRAYGTTASGGNVVLTELNEGPRSLAVEGERFRVLPPLDLFLVEGLQEQVITLEWLPGTVMVRARTSEGEVDDGLARFSGPGTVSPTKLGAFGTAYLTLDPGDWQVLVTSEQHGMQHRALVVPEDSTSLVVADVVFPVAERGDADLTVTVIDPDGRPVNGAEILLDGSSLGATSTAGSIELNGLSAGARTLEVKAPMFTEASRSVRLADGKQNVEVKLKWAPGAVKVITRTETGPVPDALVRFAGPSVVSPVRVDKAGERLVALSPGSWQGLASSPTAGIQQAQVEIGDKAGELVVIEFVMKAVASGASEMLVRVVDPDGLPIMDATVSLDGEAKGQTAFGGAVLLSELLPGRVALSVSAPGYLPHAVEKLRIREGSQERIVELAYLQIPVTVLVKDSSGAPVKADVRAEGPAEVAPVPTDAEGRAQLTLRPGSWRVLASSEVLGAKSQTVELDQGSEGTELAFVLEAAEVGVTAEEVVINKQVMFDFDKATIKGESTAILDEVAATLLARDALVKVEIQGHSDNTGSAAYNYELSQRRADAVVAALVERGVAPERLVARGYGATDPVASNDTEEGKAQNRRVQFDIKEVAAKQP